MIVILEVWIAGVVLATVYVGLLAKRNWRLNGDKYQA